MTRRHLLWRVFSSSYLILLACVGVILLASFFLLRFAEDNAARRQADAALDTVLAIVGDDLIAGREAEARESADQMARTLGVRITLIAPSGRVISDSAANEAAMASHRDRPEVVAAVANGRSTITRISFTTGEKTFYSASAVRDSDGQARGIVRAGVPASVAYADLARLVRLSLLIGLVVLVLGALFTFLFARGYTRPIELMRRGAERFGQGNLKRRIPAQDIIELNELADALNRMALQLDERITEITRQRNEREAILESMQEGVLAIDRNESILSLNRRGEQLLGVKSDSARGRLIQEAIRRVDLQRFIRRNLASAPEEIDDETLLHDATGRILSARSTVLRDGEGNMLGLVVILADVTRLHHLEHLRREFVANVSHELKTPITSISGFAETLLDGALEEPDSARRFVSIIARQSERLGEIIEDLLSLSRLDRAEDLEREEYRLVGLVREAIDNAAPAAEEAGVRIETEGLDLMVKGRVNRVLMIQAMGNLIQNAIKYGRAGGVIRVVLAETDGEVRFSVRDFGPGIGAEHLPRLFERFYRVDKARSRDQGGTGLGLSIVKNVAQAHGGEAEVWSEPGAGSEFTLRFPRGSI